MLVTDPAVAPKLAALAPAATVTDAGTGTVGLLLESETSAPPPGAGAESVTVHVVFAPVPKVVGAQETELKTAGASTDTWAVFEVPL